MTLFEEQIAPHNVPSLGGFSINVFTLNNLYNLFLKGRAWWSHSNNESPLIRYTGATITLFRAESSDYIFKYYNCYPMEVSLEAYNSTQPTFMQLSKNHKIMRCKKHNIIRKPYTKIHVKPPAQLTNKWYFQKDLADTPLLMTFATAMSLDRFFISSTSQSSSIGFYGLNTKIIKFHDFIHPTTHGYRFQDQIYIWSVQQSTPKPDSLTNIELQNLIYLGYAGKMQPGKTIKDADPTSTHSWTEKLDYYSQHWDHWGNPFIPYYFKGTGILLYTNEAPGATIIKMKAKQANDKVSSLPQFKYFVEPLITEYRYNYFADTGPGNKTYLVDLNSIEPTWDPPPDEKLQNNNLPIWLSLWGFTDWYKLNKIPVDTERLIVLQTNNIWPPDKYIVPIDLDFLKGNSPYRGPNEVTASDKLNWHPKGCFQYQSITSICTGPGTIKLPQNVSAEAHMNITFYFKLGGCAQPIKNIDKPGDQPDFPIPRIDTGSNSLQSPETPIESFLYSFDWRRHFLTKRATQRIEESPITEISPITPTGFSLLNALPSKQKTPEGTAETTEKEKEALFQFLKLLREQQQTYRQRILQLVGNFES